PPPPVARIQVHPGLALVLATPAYGVETAAARAVLPKDVSRHDAVLQAACLGSLVLGLERGDASLIRGALFDRIAEPPRRHLYPGYAEARAAALDAGAPRVAASGARAPPLALAAAPPAHAGPPAPQAGPPRLRPQAPPGPPGAAPP